jgi:hypothetical protein
VADESEIDRLDPEHTQVKLVSGFPIEVVRLRTRQLFRLMRILTRGANPAALAQLKFTDDTEEGKREFVGQLLSILLMAIPDAEQEAIGFLQSMTKPAGLVEKPAAQMSKKQSEDNQALMDRYNEEMFNPDLEDTISLFESIIENEAPDIQALGKKLQHLLGVARKALGAERPLPPPEGTDLHSPEPTLTSSTS